MNSGTFRAWLQEVSPAEASRLRAPAEGKALTFSPLSSMLRLAWMLDQTEFCSSLLRRAQNSWQRVTQLASMGCYLGQVLLLANSRHRTGALYTHAKTACWSTWRAKQGKSSPGRVGAERGLRSCAVGLRGTSSGALRLRLLGRMFRPRMYSFSLVAPPCSRGDPSQPPKHL